MRCFRGMFAFTLLDERTGELVLARDPLGIKPLYYLPRGDGVVLASELEALVAAVGPELRIGLGALVASMLYYWVSEQLCAVDGVQKLAAGSQASFRPDGGFAFRFRSRIVRGKQVPRPGHADVRSGYTSITASGRRFHWGGSCARFYQSERLRLRAVRPPEPHVSSPEAR